MNNSSAQNEAGFQAMDLGPLNQIMEEKSPIRLKSYQIKYNKAYVTIYKDGTVILFPGAAGLGQGIFFEDIKYLEPMIKTGIYPVKGDGSFWEKEKDRALDFQKSMPYYCTKLSELLSYKVELNDNPEYLKELSGIVNKKFKEGNVPDNLYNYLAIFVGELLRGREKAEWKLLCQNSLNVYYCPELVKDRKYCDPFSYIIGELEMADFRPIDINTMIEGANNFYRYHKRNYLDSK